MLAQFVLKLPFHESHSTECMLILNGNKYYDHSELCNLEVLQKLMSEQAI